MTIASNAPQSTAGSSQTAETPVIRRASSAARSSGPSSSRCGSSAAVAMATRLLPTPSPERLICSCGRTPVGSSVQAVEEELEEVLPVGALPAAAHGARDGAHHHRHVPDADVLAQDAGPLCPAD